MTRKSTFMSFWDVSTLKSINLIGFDVKYFKDFSIESFFWLSFSTRTDSGAASEKCFDSQMSFSFTWKWWKFNNLWNFRKRVEYWKIVLKSIMKKSSKFIHAHDSLNRISYTKAQEKSVLGNIEDDWNKYYVWE